MTAIHEYPTPLTDAQAEHEWHHVPTVPASHARDLERKLAMCRDALTDAVETLAGFAYKDSDDVEVAMRLPSWLPLAFALLAISLAFDA